MTASDPHEKPATAPTGYVGRTIGSYRLIRILGSGGMGTVYLAEHLRIGRQVAVKLLRPEVKDRREVAKRFLAEARAMGRVSHPGVVSILDLDSLEDGTAYLVMEYLPGTSLRAQLRGGSGPPSLETSLRILHQAALGMAAAHAAGVIHRDLSPANIMLGPPDEGDGPKVKILDFGLARLATPDGASDSSLSTTRDGAMLGTLKYMAPEQCLDPHSVDEQADVYALGVIGYELLAGSPPFSAPSGWELISLHLREPPPPLPAVTADGKSELPPPLAALILSMLAKTPLGRPDMNEVAARLAELLPNRPSSPAPIAKPFVRRSRRRQRLILWSALVLLGLVTASLVTVGLYARRQMGLAELRRRETLTAASELLGVINRNLRTIPGAASASNALLDTTERLLDRLSAQSPSDLEVREATAHLHTLRGEIVRNHGSLPDSRRSFERAILLSEQLVAAQPQSVPYRARLASAYDGLADVLEQLSELPLAKTSYEKALNIRLELLQKTPDDPARVQDVVGSYLLRGDLSRAQGQQRLALADYEKARPLLEPLWRREPDRKTYRWQMCGILYRLAQTTLNVGKAAPALQHAERAVDLLLRIAPSDQQGASYHLLLARVLMTRGDVRERLGRTLDAEHDYAQALDIVRGLLKASPSDVQVRRALMDSSYKAIDEWLRLGNLPLAEATAGQIELTAEQLLKSDPSNQGNKWRLAASLQRLGDIALRRGRIEEARKRYQRAIELQESLSMQGPDYARHRDRMVWLWERQADATSRTAFPAQALPIWGQTLALLSELERVDPASVDVRLAQARILRKRGVLRYKLAQKAEGLGDFTAAARIAEELSTLDVADASARRELILVEFARALALGSEIATQPDMSQRLANAREQLLSLKTQGLLVSDVEMLDAERALAKPASPIK